MAGVDPAAVHPTVQRIGLLGIYGAAADDAAERRLDVSGRAAETVVEVEVAEGGVEIVLPHQTNRPQTQPDAFGVGGGAAQNLRGLGQFVELALAFLLGVVLAARGARWGGLGVAALSQNRGR